MKQTINLLCFPYAGGSSSVYKKWEDKFVSDIHIVPMELPGRGSKFNQKLETDFEQMLSILYEEVLKIIEKNDTYAFWGHSMGSLIEYYLVQRLMANNQILPKHIFFSGQVPPNYLKKEFYYHLNDYEFFKYLRSLGGIPDEILYNEELCEIFLPILRSDMMAVNTAELVTDGRLIPVNISVLYGSNDNSVDKSVMDKWKETSSKQCEFLEFVGNHFFINQYEKEILELIEKRLEAFENGEK